MVIHYNNTPKIIEETCHILDNSTVISYEDYTQVFCTENDIESKPKVMDKYDYKVISIEIKSSNKFTISLYKKMTQLIIIYWK